LTSSPAIVIQSTPASDQVKGSEAFGRSLKILTWNMAKQTENPDWQREFASILDRYQPDLVFLQEVRLCAATRRLPGVMELAWHFAPNFLDRHHNAYSGVLTASDLACDRSHLLLTEHHEPIVRTPKVALFNEFGIPAASPLLTVNAHLINFVDLGRFRAQLQQLEARMMSHDGPIVLAGDFNTWHRWRWQALIQMTDRVGLQPIQFAQGEVKKIKRFLQSPPLDYIFYRGFQGQIGNAKVVSKIKSSDHYPLFAELVA
jgi:endonuclease/exonuclease/phosphatase (EEP) superfamily protein YafD